MENLHNIDDVQPILLAHRMHTNILRKHAKSYEHVSYRFFPTSRDVENLVYRMQKKMCTMVTE